MKKLGILALIAFIVLAVPIFAAPGIDLSVEDVLVTPSPADLGDTITAEITVKNLGNETASNAILTYEVWDDKGTTTVNGSATLDLNVSETKVESFNWTPDKTGTFAVLAGISVTGDANASNNYKGTAVEVESELEITNLFATPIIYVDGDGDMYSNQSLIIDGYMKENGTGTNDTVKIYIEGSLYDTINSSAEQNGYFKSEETELWFSETGTWNVEAKVIRGLVVVATSTTSFEVVETGNGDGDEDYAVEVYISPDVLELDSGDEDTFEIEVKNLGNEEDAYDITLYVDDEIEDWFDLEDDYVRVNSGETATIDLDVDVQSNADPDTYDVTVKAKGRAIDSDTAELEIGGDENYLVDVDVSPSSLEIEAGDSDDYEIRIRNLGDYGDNYDIIIYADTEVMDWLDLEDDYISVSDGRTEYIDLEVDVPSNAENGVYDIRIKVRGESEDTDTIDLVVTGGSGDSDRHYGSSLYDLDIGRPSVSPDVVYSNNPRRITVSAPVTFRDLTLLDGRYVTIKLYLDDDLIDTQSAYFVNDQTKDIKFTLDTDEYPIYNEPGNYEFYYIAELDSESDESPVDVLTVKRSSGTNGGGTPNGGDGNGGNGGDDGTGNGGDGNGGDGDGTGGTGPITISLPDTDFKVLPNSTFTIKLDITNNKDTKERFDVYMQDINSSLSPDVIEVEAGESKSIDIDASVGDIPLGSYSGTLFVENYDTRLYKDIDVEVVSELEGGGPGAAITGFVSFMGGGGLAALIGAIILVALLGYYYYSRKEEEEIEDHKKEGAPAVGNGLNAGDDMPPEVREILERRKTAMAQEPIPVERKFTTKDAEKVLGNAEHITADFNHNLKEVKHLRKSLKDIHKTAKDTEVKWAKHAKVEKKPVEKDYIHKVTDAV